MQKLRKKIQFYLSIMIAGFMLSCLNVTYAQSPPIIDFNAYYSLSSLWQGEGKSLEVVFDKTNNNMLQLADSANASNQYWRFTPLPGGYYRLTTKWLGEGKALSVIQGGANDQLQMVNSGYYVGQRWKVAHIRDGYNRLTTEWQGKGKALDGVNDLVKNNRLQLANTGEFAGQFWKFKYVGPAQPITRKSPFVINPNGYYRLRSHWFGWDCSLGIKKDGRKNMGAIVHKSDPSPNLWQLWKFTPAGGGFYRMSTKGHGNELAFSALTNGANKWLELIDIANYAGQFWKVTPVSGDFFRLTTQSKGDGMSLDIIKDGANHKLQLANTGKYVGQLWTLEWAGE